MMHDIVASLKTAIEDWVSGPDSLQYLAVLPEVAYERGRPSRVTTRVLARLDIRLCQIEPETLLSVSKEIDGRFTNTPLHTI